MSEATIIAAFGEFRGDPTSPRRTTLRRSVEVYVDRMREAGEPPEAVVIAIKAIAHRAGLERSGTTVGRGSLDENDLPMSEFITCAIERYYNAE